MQAIGFAVELYEPEMLSSADARTTITYDGKPRSVINLCSYNYLGLANHPEVIAAAHDALTTHGLGACGSPDAFRHDRSAPRTRAQSSRHFSAVKMRCSSTADSAARSGTISGLLRKTDVAVLDNRSHRQSARWRDSLALPSREIRAQRSGLARRVVGRQQGKAPAGRDRRNLLDGRRLREPRRTHQRRRIAWRESSSSTKRIPSWPAVSTVAARRKNSASRTAFPSPTGPFRKPLARSAVSSPVRGRRCNTCAITRIRTYIPAPCPRSWSRPF